MCPIVSRLRRFLVPAILVALACTPASASARTLAPGLSDRTASAIIDLAHAHWPGTPCSVVGGSSVRGLRGAAAVDPRRGCAILVNARRKLTPLGWCRALKPVFARLANGTKPSVVPYDCMDAVGPLPSPPRRVTPAGVSAAQARLAYRIASEHWPTSGCKGREQVRVAPTAQLLARTLSADEPGTLIMGAAGLRDPRCVVYLNGDVPRWSPALLCLVAEHEFGHLAGHKHSTTPDDVMNAIDGRSPDCEEAFGITTEIGTEVTDAEPPTAETVTAGGFGGVGFG
jgi:hypothetical protein